MDERYINNTILDKVNPVSFQTETHGGARGEYQHITIILELRDELNPTPVVLTELVCVS